MSDPRRDHVRGTIWFGREHSATGPRDMPPSESTGQTVESQSSRSSLVPLKRPTAAKSSQHFASCELSTQNPWEIYKPWAGVFYGKQMVLAQNRQQPTDLVHIEVCLAARREMETVVQTMTDCAHRNVRRLVKILQHANHFFLIWEPIEFSLHQVIVSKYCITERELALIAWPVLKGIRFLCERKKFIECLSPRHIFVTKEGSIKLGGVEQASSHETVNTGGAQAMLTAFASIMERLMGNNGVDFRWSSEVCNLLSVMSGTSSGGIPDGFWRHPFFEQMDGEGGLTLLIKLVNKVSYHEVKGPRGL